jgi:hypothetical protein
MHIHYLLHIQGVSFINLTAIKACIRHSNDRHRAQENIKAGLAYFNFLTVEQIDLGGHHLACGCPLEPAGRISPNLVSALCQWKELQPCVYGQLY